MYWLVKRATWRATDQPNAVRIADPSPGVSISDLEKTVQNACDEEKRRQGKSCVNQSQAAIPSRHILCEKEENVPWLGAP